MDRLINKYLNNDLTAEDSENLKAWLEADVKNRVEFENIVAHLKHSDLEFDSLKNKIYSKIVSGADVNETDSSIKYREKPKHKIRLIMEVAAVFAILFTSIIVLLEYSHEENEVSINRIETVEIEKEAVLGQKLTFKLPDGTSVKLNAGSKLLYPKVFNKHERRVELEGEAFFDVVPNSESPFHIETKALNIKVVGTSFNVRSYQDDNTTKIGVKSGTVKVSTRVGNDEVVLQPSQIAQYSNSSNSISKDTILFSNAVFGWMDKELVFNDTSFEQVLTELSRWYGIDFKIEGQFDSEQRLTSLYKNPTLKSVLTSLSYVYNYNFEIHEKSVEIIKSPK